jgi:ectoine hydroxylase-related dioxygenase (phytanoyl-CoA dioxygenase family)
MTGPGVIVLRRAFADVSAVDAASAVFRDIIAQQRANNATGGDHFAKPGANDRIWNALEKLCLRAPETFAAYYANEMLALVSEAWLGPAYQFTSQVNVVNPGGAAQTAHNDYHLGFMTSAQMERYPAHVHRLSPVLTLQGAVAHTEMPVESGPTLYLRTTKSIGGKPKRSLKAASRCCARQSSKRIPGSSAGATLGMPWPKRVAPTLRSSWPQVIAGASDPRRSATSRASRSITRAGR